MTSKPNPIVFWLKNARPIALPQSVLPAIFAFCLTIDIPILDPSLADTSKLLDLGLGVLAIIGIIFAHLSMNLWDDYFDWKILQKSEASGSDAMDKRRPSKCTYLADGSATVAQLRTAGLVFLVLALCCAGVIFYYRGLSILPLLAILLVLGIFYSAPPLKLSYRGLGEVVIGVLMGPTLMSGVIISTIGVLPLPSLFITCATGILITVILYVHSMLDLAADKAAGKTTLAGLLKTNPARLLTLKLLLILAYTLLLLAITLDFLPPVYTIMFLSAPISAQLIRSMDSYYQLGTEAPSQPRAWQGPFGPKQRWQIFKDKGMVWFMYRWLLARNNLMIFCLLGIVAGIVNILNS